MKTILMTVALALLLPVGCGTPDAEDGTDSVAARVERAAANPEVYDVIAFTADGRREVFQRVDPRQPTSDAR